MTDVGEDCASRGWDPADYHRHSSAQLAWARELIAKLALQGHERVLDVGCGDGKVTALLAELLPAGSVLGVDNSDEMVGFARTSFPPERAPNVRFRVMDARELAFDAEFDVVFSNAALHWVRDHRPVLRGIARSLRPGGRCLLQMGGRGNAAGVLGVMDVLIVSDRWASHFRGFSFPYGFHGPEEYRDWLAQAGLRPRRVELIPKDMVQAGSEGLAGWLRTTWMPYTRRVPPARREALVVEIVEDYLRRHPPDEDGSVHVAMVRLEVEADKPTARGDDRR